ncbi:MAG: hypothetical protein QXO22_06550 [Thermosphaera sp.]
MGISARSTEWLVNRAQYLREKLRAIEIILNQIRELQKQNRDSIAFVEAAEAALRSIESQKQYISMSLNAIEAELTNREVKFKRGGGER